MDASDSMFPVTRTVIDAEKGVCKAIDHQIIRTDRISLDDRHEIESLDGFYCPTCNKFWREP
jgi:hypothetical protein